MHVFRKLLSVILVAVFIHIPTTLSAEDFTTNEEQVAKAYLAYYGRFPDLGGFNFWVSSLEDKSGDLSAIIGAFGTSNEFDTRFGSFSNEELIDNLFQQMFDRSADPEGLLFFTSSLDAGTRTLQDIAMDIINGAKGEDLVLIDSKLLNAQEELLKQEDNEEPGLSDSYRPDREWINQFPTRVTVTTSGSISDAISSCDSLVGADGYCVVEIGGTPTGLPLVITRSKTKLSGINHIAPPHQPLLKLEQNGTFISIGDNIHDVIIESLELEGHKAGTNEIFGIIIQGESINNILIRNNTIHDFESDKNAHGIAVYGSGSTEQTSIKNIIIEGNNVYSMQTGSSESIVINGNVENWEVKSNHVYDVNNIAIDAIGGEGTSATKTDSNGRVLPGTLDAARYGFIESNIVENMSTLGNPAYNKEEIWAAAIYIDGGHHIDIKNNIVGNASWGYEVGAENCLTTHHVFMEGNSSSSSNFGDFVVGGYAEGGFEDDLSINCDPTTSSDDGEGHGYVDSVTLSENRFSSSNDGSPITIEFRVTNLVTDIEPESIYQNITSLASDLQCEQSSQCKAVAIGKKPCGGPTSYLLYSTKTVEEKSFLELVTGYNDSIVLDPDAVSDCSFLIEPTVVCEAQKCVTFLVN